MIGYVAKDKDEEVYLYTGKPTYDTKLDCWFHDPNTICITGEFSEFDNMSYIDEPIKVEINIKRV